MEIYSLLTVGDCKVYERNRKGERIPKYFVLRVTDGKILEEFQRKEAACKWAVANSDQEGK